ncbi:Lrp/AsnC family transcriptional regulator [Vitreoscilla massiliensis]|uniref:Lrp/AsnC family transcriptional regulator n=1 Tax=Vitreoscilla massiliensis TaxID=1689272 RepID=A0ABY4E3T1_9NEIS|nr:Lrp/AsnC family transcriptional regulator [Vitreoscilla massiliensis]UOO89983.1 Lrp/AsnC family transcriptional regulator [Vitreoscilla massiliensis]
MNKLDKKILAHLQAEGRLSVTELAERIGLSVSPCHRRVKTLEDTGVIQGYRAQLNPELVGLNFSAIIFVTLKDGNRDSLQAFEAAIIDIPQIVQAQRLFGTPDYLLQIVTTNLASFQKLYDDKLAAIPSIQRLTSTIVMKDVVSGRALPI